MGVLIQMFNHESIIMLISLRNKKLRTYFVLNLSVLVNVISVKKFYLKAMCQLNHFVYLKMNQLIKIPYIE